MSNNDYKKRFPFWENEGWSLEDFLTVRIEKYKDIRSIMDQDADENRFNRPKYEQEAIDHLLRAEKFNAALLDPNSPYMKYKTKEMKEAKYDETYERLKNVDGGVLIWWINNLLIEREIAYQTIDLLANELVAITPKYIDDIIDHHRTTKNRQKGRANKYKSDKEYMRQCLNVITKFNQTIIDPEHYIPFRKLVIKHYKPSDNEGELIPVMEDTPHGWAESTMREFFEEETGEKPTTLL